jgi:hypothetical protein
MSSADGLEAGEQLLQSALVRTDERLPARSLGHSVEQPRRVGRRWEVGAEEHVGAERLDGRTVSR